MDMGKSPGPTNVHVFTLQARALASYSSWFLFDQRIAEQAHPYSPLTTKALSFDKIHRCSKTR